MNPAALSKRAAKQKAKRKARLERRQERLRKQAERQQIIDQVVADLTPKPPPTEWWERPARQVAKVISFGRPAGVPFLSMDYADAEVRTMAHVARLYGQPQIPTFQSLISKLNGTKKAGEDGTLVSD